MSAKPVITPSAQQTARRWLESGLHRAEQMERTVSGAGEEAEILGTIIEMLDTATERGFRIGFEHAVAGGEEASKKHGIPRHLLPLVIYFGSEEDRREMINAVLEAKPGMVTVKIPERRK
jgi:hypothetical protein